jgi:O-antigen/teichoic acid export membrane protein
MKLTRLFENELISSLSIMGLRGGMLVGKFLLSLFIARYMGLEDLGVYALIAGVVAVGQVVMRFGIFASISREAVNQPIDELLHNLRHYGVGCVVAYIVLIPAFYVGGAHFGSAALGLLTLVVMFLEQASFDAFVLTNNLQKPKLANVIYALQSALWIYLFVVLAFFIEAFRSLENIMVFWIGGGFFSLFLSLFLTRKWPWRTVFSRPFSRIWYAPYFMKSWRLYMGDIISTMTMYLDRYLITFFLSLELVGVYILFWQVANAICNLIGAGVIQVYRPRLISAYNQNDSALFRTLFVATFKRGLGGTTILSLVCAAIVPFLVVYADKPLAMEYLPLFWLMLFTLLFRVATDIVGAGLYARHMDRIIVQSNIIRFGLAIIVGVASLSTLGIYGVVVIPAIVYTASIIYTRIQWHKG